MTHDFKIGDRVEWNSEAGRVRGTITKKVTSEITFKGYTVHASKEEPQYLIESDKTDHRAMHKGSALKKIDKGTAEPKKGGRPSPTPEPSSTGKAGPIPGVVFPHPIEPQRTSHGDSAHESCHGG